MTSYGLYVIHHHSPGRTGARGSWKWCAEQKGEFPWLPKVIFKPPLISLSLIWNGSIIASEKPLNLRDPRDPIIPVLSPYVSLLCGSGRPQMHPPPKSNLKAKLCDRSPTPWIWKLGTANTCSCSCADRVPGPHPLKTGTTHSQHARCETKPGQARLGDMRGGRGGNQ